MFALKLVDWKKDRYTVFEIIEESASEFTIRARNNFKSFSNCSHSLTLDSESSVYDTAMFVAKKSLIRDLFAVDYS